MTSGNAHVIAGPQGPARQPGRPRSQLGGGVGLGDHDGCGGWHVGPPAAPQLREEHPATVEGATTLRDTIHLRRIACEAASGGRLGGADTPEQAELTRGGGGRLASVWGGAVVP